MKQETNWIKETIDVGVVREKTSVNVQFLYTGKCLPGEVELKPSCGCTGVKWIPENRVLAAVLKVGSIPKHLKNNWEISKSIKMTYLCHDVQREDVLRIKATVIKDVTV